MMEIFVVEIKNTKQKTNKKQLNKTYISSWLFTKLMVTRITENEKKYGTRHNHRREGFHCRITIQTLTHSLEYFSFHQNISLILQSFNRHHNTAMKIDAVPFLMQVTSGASAPPLHKVKEIFGPFRRISRFVGWDHWVLCRIAVNMWQMLD